jgi:hypothetical protein
MPPAPIRASGADSEKNHGVSDYVTYVNPNMGFTGSSYRASGWHLLGTEPGTTYRYLDERYITDRALSAAFPAGPPTRRPRKPPAVTRSAATRSTNRPCRAHSDCAMTETSPIQIELSAAVGTNCPLGRDGVEVALLLESLRVLPRRDLPPIRGCA